MKTMRDRAVASWFRNQFLLYEQRQGGPTTISEFSDWLGLTQPTGSAYMNGTRKPSYQTAIKICRKLGDWSLFKVLNYSLPEKVEIPLEDLPPDLAERLRDALLELSETIKNNGIAVESDRAAKVSKEILEKHGFIVNSISRDG